jgi:biotin--protein ligase
MSAPPHQVLIYSGPGTSSGSIHQTTLTLSSILTPNYTITPITLTSLLSDPWQKSCALLVIPGGRDLPYVSALAGRGNALIRDFVEGGGAYWGICAGGYYGCREVRFAVGDEGMQVVGQRELGFWEGACEGPVWSGFEYGSERGSRGCGIDVDLEALEGVMGRVRKTQNLPQSTVPPKPLLDSAHFDHLYFNGGGAFVPLEPSSTSSLSPTPPRNSTILARYASHPSSLPAAVHIAISKGQVLLTGLHPEYSILSQPLSDVLTRSQQGEECGADKEAVTDLETRKAKEEERKTLVRAFLRVLGLRVPGLEEDGKDDGSMLYGGKRPTQPLPQILNSHPNKPELYKKVLTALEPHLSKAASSSPPSLDKLSLSGSDSTSTTSPRVLKGSNDTFHLYLSSSLSSPSTTSLSPISTFLSSHRDAPPTPSDQYDGMTKHILIVEPEQRTEVENDEACPMWDWKTYWGTLDRARKTDGLGERDEVRAGDLIFYSQAVTSTQTMWDKNPSLLTSLPPLSLSTASFQMAGRGRGGNTWLSPPGCLQFTLLATLPLAQASRVVFVQYLAGLAICEALDPDFDERGKGGVGMRIKWPNDVYGLVKGEKLKMGGILVNSHYVNGEFRLMIGTCSLPFFRHPPSI